jgi:hypothetical protein
MGELAKGQKVRIVGGFYKKYGTGTYIEACGRISCRVKVDGDKQAERTLRLSSIQPFPPPLSTDLQNLSRNYGVNERFKDDGDIRSMGQWTHDTYNNKPSSNNNDTKETLRVMRNALRKHAKLVEELQASIIEMQKIIDNLDK